LFSLWLFYACNKPQLGSGNFTGESYRKVQKFLKLQGVTVSHVAVMKWIKKYTRLMNSYVEKIKPNVSDT